MIIISWLLLGLLALICSVYTIKSKIIFKQAVDVLDKWNSALEKKRKVIKLLEDKNKLKTQLLRTIKRENDILREFISDLADDKTFICKEDIIEYVSKLKINPNKAKELDLSLDQTDGINNAVNAVLNYVNFLDVLKVENLEYCKTIKNLYTPENTPVNVSKKELDKEADEVSDDDFLEMQNSAGAIQ